MLTEAGSGAEAPTASTKHGRFLTIRCRLFCYTRDKMQHLFWGGGFRLSMFSSRCQDGCARPRAIRRRWSSSPCWPRWRSSSLLKTQDGRAPKVATGADTEVSSQAKRIARFAPTPAQWAALGMEPVKTMTFRSEHMTEGKISINEDQGDADLSALCRAGDAADGQARRHGEARPAAVLHRSRRHGAGAERFPHRACRRSIGRSRA